MTEPTEADQKLLDEIFKAYTEQFQKMYPISKEDREKYHRVARNRHDEKTEMALNICNALYEKAPNAKVKQWLQEEIDELQEDIKRIDAKFIINLAAKFIQINKRLF